MKQRTEVEKDPREEGRAGAVEQGRFQRNIYLRVIGMWQRRRREAASWPQYCKEEEEGGPGRRRRGRGAGDGEGAGDGDDGHGRGDGDGGGDGRR